MRRTLAVVVTTLALGAFIAPSLALAECGVHQSASVASAEQTSKPVQQSQAPTEQAK